MLIGLGQGQGVATLRLLYKPRVFLVLVGMLCYLSNMIPRQMKHLPYKNLKYRFDFDIGYFIKSPCRECEKRKDFPECMDGCNILDKIHSILCESISCSRRF